MVTCRARDRLDIVRLVSHGFSWISGFYSGCVVGVQPKVCGMDEMIIMGVGTLLSFSNETE